MRSPGITVRPLRQMTGEAEFNEVFFEAVRVPRENLLGELHGGWQVAVSALQNERGILYVVGMQILLSEARDRLLALARERGAGRDPITRQALAGVHLGTEIFRMNCQRTLDKLLRILPVRRNTPDLMRRIRSLAEQGDFSLKRFNPGTLTR